MIFFRAASLCVIGLSLWRSVALPLPTIVVPDSDTAAAAVGGSQLAQTLDSAHHHHVENGTVHAHHHDVQPHHGEGTPQSTDQSALLLRRTDSVEKARRNQERAAQNMKDLKDLAVRKNDPEGLSEDFHRYAEMHQDYANRPITPEMAPALQHMAKTTINLGVQARKALLEPPKKAP